jgi:hypothetical protein
MVCFISFQLKGTVVIYFLEKTILIFLIFTYFVAAFGFYSFVSILPGMPYRIELLLLLCFSVKNFIDVLGA